MNVEPASAQDARVEALWNTFDTDHHGYLNLSDLRKGLRKLDHPLKNAHGFLEKILNAMDTNHDGRISFTEFQTFVKHTERELLSLFDSIDRNHDGSLDKDEVASAFRQAGLIVSNAKLDSFFDKIDTNHDGHLSFEEWRDFLLFIPAEAPDLQNILAYFSSTVRLSPEGDVLISDETIAGLGNKIHSFLTPFFRIIFEIATPPRRHPPHPYPLPQYLTPSSFDEEPHPSHYLPPEEGDMDQALTLAGPFVTKEYPPDFRDSPGPDLTAWENLKSILSACLPTPGYFIAGGLAGTVSRTTTAPLDRLKVYLIAQTGTATDAIEAAKSGTALQAIKGAWRTSANAMKDLWAAGGIRSLWAGNGLNVLKIMPESAIKFGTYEAMKRVFAKFEGHHNPQNITSLSRFLSGGISGMTAQFFVYPLDTLKFRMQCETVEGGLHGNALIVQTMRKMWREGGIRPYFRGLSMGLVGMFPYAAIDLATFEYLKGAMTVRNAARRKCHEDDAAPGSFTTALIGAFSGALGATVVYPVNLLRTRLQSQGTVLHPRTYPGGIRDVFQQTVHGEGYRALFKGLTPNLLKVVPAVSITYVIYEHAKKRLNLR